MFKILALLLALSVSVKSDTFGQVFSDAYAAIHECARNHVTTAGAKVEVAEEDVALIEEGVQGCIEQEGVDEAVSSFADCLSDECMVRGANKNSLKGLAPRMKGQLHRLLPKTHQMFDVKGLSPHQRKMMLTIGREVARGIAQCSRTAIAGVVAAGCDVSKDKTSLPYGKIMQKFATCRKPVLSSVDAALRKGALAKCIKPVVLPIVDRLLAPATAGEPQTSPPDVQSSPPPPPMQSSPPNDMTSPPPPNGQTSPPRMESSPPDGPPPTTDAQNLPP